MSATLETVFLVFVFDLGYDIDSSSCLRFGFALQSCDVLFTEVAVGIQELLRGGLSKFSTSFIACWWLVSDAGDYVNSRWPTQHQEHNTT
jgi:hypothetical protein